MKKIETIIIYPHSRLRQSASKLSLNMIKSPELSTIINDMTKLMYQAGGVGLAAVQVDLDMNLTIIDTQDGSGLQVFINPKIISHSIRTDIEEEGCLSIPGVFGLVKRWRKITIEYLDQNGIKKTLKASPFLSRVLQHEVDHLNGVLFIDKTDKINKNQKLLDTWNKGEKPLLNIPYPYKYE